jgi:hypothetical protein
MSKRNNSVVHYNRQANHRANHMGGDPFNQMALMQPSHNPFDQFDRMNSQIMSNFGMPRMDMSKTSSTNSQDYFFTVDFLKILISLKI